MRERNRKGYIAAVVTPVFFVMGALAAHGQSEEDAAALLSEAEGLLANSAWVVSVTPLAGSKDALKLQQDTLIFKENRVQSEFLQAFDYPATGYTVSVNNAGKRIWETMQTSESHGIAFWRGELSDSGMHGMVSIQPREGDTANYSFRGEPAEMPQDVKMNIRDAVQEPVAPPLPPTQPEPQVETKAPESDERAVKEAKPEKKADPEQAAPQPKKKRGWLF